MKVLWLGGIVLPRIAEAEEMKVSNMNGWLIKISELIGRSDNYELVYVFDSYKKIKGSNEFYSYYGIENHKADWVRLGDDYINQATEILKFEKPDIIHIWGSERTHTLAMAEAAERLNMIVKVVISIQGLVSAIYHHYTGYLPSFVVNRHSLRDIIQGNIRTKANRFKIQGKYEIEALQKVKHVIGRTEWDRACMWEINPRLEYHFNNETLRDIFYSGSWDQNSCEKHSIFCSQAGYPVKGLHLALEAMKRIVAEYPDATLYIGGKDFSSEPKWKLTYYHMYILSLIKKYSLENNVRFTGYLDAEGMKERYLKTNVFLSPSSIENSPNSLGEAMILGVPCVSSQVGGVHNLLVHGKEGYLYPADETYVLSYYVCKLFKDNEKAIEFGNNARNHAMKTHDVNENYSTLLRIYTTINEKYC